MTNGCLVGGLSNCLPTFTFDADVYYRLSVVSSSRIAHSCLTHTPTHTHECYLLCRSFFYVLAYCTGNACGSKLKLPRVFEYAVSLVL
jgi:hypothetical protein